MALRAYIAVFSVCTMGVARLTAMTTRVTRSFPPTDHLPDRS